jgi:Low psii accumulation1 / Rep27
VEIQLAVIMGRKILQSSLFGALLFVAISDAFVSIPISDNTSPIALRQHLGHQKTIMTSMAVWSENPKNKSGGGLEEGMRNKLVAESIAPWRTIRLFLYGALGSGAFVGGLINLSGAVAASNSPEFNLETEVS